MIAVVIAGGQGTRLWPLSTSEKPKHLLKIISERSLLQDAFDRAQLAADDIYVVTDKSHAHHVREQLPELDEQKIIVEPDRRGTASCILLALAHIANSHDDDPEVAFFHADHHILDKQAFAGAVREAALNAREHDSIALIGIEPEYPATGFGYIKQGEKLNGSYKVDSFKEKPDEKTAEKYLNSGQYLWNLGLFAAPLSVFQKAFAEYASELDSGFKDLVKLLSSDSNVDDRYRELDDEPIDTALIEKTKNVIVVPGRFDWMDIGSFKDLHDVMPGKDEYDNSLSGDGAVHMIDTRSSIVISHNKPVAVIGLENVAVIDTPEGILVCHKDYSQKVKEVAKKVSSKSK